MMWSEITKFQEMAFEMDFAICFALTGLAFSHFSTLLQKKLGDFLAFYL